jgi:hypothetical protein
MQRFREVEELFSPARAVCGDWYGEQLYKHEELSKQIRGRFENGSSSSGNYPAVYKFLSDFSAEEKEMFFKTVGM